MSAKQFPLFLMKIGDKREFLPIREAGIAIDNGWTAVEVVGLVLEADFSVRDITREEASRISDIADENSASK